MEKTIICNTCIGSRIFELKKEQFNNPFIWNLISHSDFLELMQSFDTLDFNNIKTRVDQKTKLNPNTGAVVLTIDDKIDIPYVHHHENKSYKEPVTKDIDIYYCDMQNYVQELYRKRLARMTGKNIFIFSSSEDDIGFLDLKIPYEKIMATDNHSIKSNDTTKVVYVDFKQYTIIQAQKVLAQAKEMFT